jgi:hydrogenase expression/formation protein HypC
MCLAIPARLVTEPNDIQMVEVDILGVKRHISVMMTPGAKEGDYVLVHAGFAIQVVDEDFAAETLEMLRKMGIQNADELAEEAECAAAPEAADEVSA